MNSILPKIKLEAGSEHYAVMGNPIAHSLSPQIHKQFAHQTDQNLIYHAIEVPLDKFVQMVEQFRTAGGFGLNITLPFKQQAWKISDQRSAIAERAGAVNTLWFDGQGKIIGDNTDGRGLVRDLIVNHGLAIHAKRILILGAGGAVKGVLQSILEEDPESCVVVNRTISRAEEIVDQFSDLGNVSAVEYADLSTYKFDLVINGTSASLQGKLPPLTDNLLEKGAGCYDMMYATQPTAFVKWGVDQGAAVSVDGIGMLVEQAAESFFLWRGIRPDTFSVLSSFRR